MKKIILSIFAILIFITNVQAKPVKSDLTTIIKGFDIDKNSIAVSIKNAENGNVVYSLNDKILINPASVQKILTVPAAYATLGEDYKFKTELYLRDDNSYLLKLSGDPYLKTSDLKSLVKPIKVDAKNVFIDDSVLDNTKTWGEGWQWDDDMNVLMPRFGAYNINGNLAKLTFVPQDNKFVQVINNNKYPFTFCNNLKVSNKNTIEIRRDIAVSQNALILSGTVSKPVSISVPISNIKQYFEKQLTIGLEENRVYIKNPYSYSKLLPNDTLINSTERDINFVVNDILKNSNNMSAEILFKLAGRSYSKNETGTDILGINMFKDYCDKLSIDTVGIRIVDGSGVSKNNLVSADFVSEYLYKNKNNRAMEFLPAPGEGTLVQRMLPLKDDLRAKTGTLADVSSIAGYITSKSGKKYVFCILQNDVKLSPSDKKMLEDYILRDIYIKG